MTDRLAKAADAVLVAIREWEEHPNSKECMDAFYAANHEQNMAMDEMWFPEDALEKLEVKNDEANGGSAITL